jgi:hypothetical protein
VGEVGVFQYTKDTIELATKHGRYDQIPEVRMTRRIRWIRLQIAQGTRVMVVVHIQPVK